MSGIMMPIMGELAQMSGVQIVVITDPTQLPTLDVWYNADLDGSPNFNKINGSGGDVSQWTDRSGTGHNANQSGNNTFKPNWYTPVLNGNGAIRFNGTTESLTINPFSFAQSKPGFTMYVVAQMSNIQVTSNATVNNKHVTVSDTDGYKIFYNGTNWCVKASGGQGNTTVAGDTSWHRLGLIFDGNAVGNGSRLRCRIDGVEQPMTYIGTVGNTTSATTTTLYIGENAGQGFLAGNIAEMVMFTRTLSSGEVLGVEKYLKDHWAL